MEINLKKKNKEPAPYGTKGSRSGFVILFAVTLAAILLSIALGVANISQQEVKFSTSTKDTSNALYAADTGIECAEVNDKTTPNYFPMGGPATRITCASVVANNITPVFNSSNNSYDFVVLGLGGDGAGCAKVNIKKTANPDSTVTTVIDAKGYNIGDNTCSSSDSNRIERELQVTYGGGSSSVDSSVPLVSISASPTLGNVNSVNPQITWSATNGPTSCAFSGDWTNTNGGAVSGTSIAQGVLTTVKTYTYTLTCSNATGSSSPASATVVVSSSGPTYPSGTPWTIPGTIQAENFDTGGEGVGYHDLDSSNNGGQYRTTEGVDIEACGDTGCGYNVGWMFAPEWLAYTVNLTAPGNYTFSARVASQGAGGTFHLDSSGNNKTGVMTIPDTGGWQNYVTITKTVTFTTAGQKSLKIIGDTNGATTAVGNFNYFSLTAAPVPQNVVWTNAVGVTVSGSTLTKTAGDGYNAGASSSQSIASGDGYVEFTAPASNMGFMAGLSRGDTDQSWQDIDFAIGPNSGGNVFIYERGAFIASGWSYTAGDVFRVAVESNVVKYYKNNILLYTSSNSPNYPLLLDTSMYDNGVQINSAKIAF